MRYQGQKWALIRCRASVARQLAEIRPQLHKSRRRLSDGSTITSLGDVVEYLLGRLPKPRPKGVVTTPQPSPIPTPVTPDTEVTDQSGLHKSAT